MLSQPTPQDIITGLYVAFFNRAPDYEGLNFWLNRYAASSNSIDIFDEIARGFSTHPVFDALYSSLNNRQFVEAIYLNILGKSGDQEGIANWENYLLSNERSKMVSEFVRSSVTVDLTSADFSYLSAQELTDAQERQDLFLNKISVALEFANTFQEQSNIQNLQDPQEDPAYLASIDILSNITDDNETVENANNIMDYISSRSLGITQITLYDTFEEFADSFFGETKEQLSSSQNQTTTGLSLSSNYIEALESGYKWDKNEVTYTFYNSIPSAYYSYDASLRDGWRPLSLDMRETAREIFNEIENFIDIDFVEVSSDADIGFSLLNMDDTDGFSYFPYDDEEEIITGDIFLSSRYFSEPDLFALEEGGYGRFVMLHEIGHSLGLKHPFENGVTLPDQYDNNLYTVMSYTDYKNITTEFYLQNDGSLTAYYSYIYQTTYSLFDIATLQSKYSTNQEFSSADTLYTLEDLSGAYTTIWDSGGNDTIDVSDEDYYSIIDLGDEGNGVFSSLNIANISDQAIWWQNQIDDSYFNEFIVDSLERVDEYASLYTGENNFAISYGTVIENAIGGNGNDIFYDNFVDNILDGGNGNDTFYIGNGGWDTINGGDGEDVVVIQTPQEPNIDICCQNITVWLDGLFGADIIGVETIRLSSGEIIYSA